MKFLLDGARAGLLIGGLLTGWSFAVVNAAMADASDAAGVLYVAIAFGLLATLFILWGSALGTMADLWRFALGRSIPGTIAERVRDDPDTDHFVTSVVLAVPVGAVVVGFLVAAAHFVVTSKFVRVEFQSAGLLMIAAASAVATVVAAPALLALTGFVARRIPRGNGRSATQLTLMASGVLALLGAGAGAGYASSLDVFDNTMLAMALIGFAGTPIAMVASQRLKTRNLLWTYGIPVAGAICALVCVVGAAGWSSSTPTLREAVTRHSKLVGAEAKFLRGFADRDGDGFPSSFGGADCDDTNPEIYPGARETPGNGIDESCSGSDAQRASGNAHPSRGIVRNAIASAAAEAAKVVIDLPDPPKNLVVLLVDTLRWDHLRFAGYDRETSPNIDALAAQSTVFAQTYATSPHTPRSIPAIFLSRYPSHTQWRGGAKGAQFNYPKLLPENLSFFEVLAEHGHYNVGVSSHFYFDPKRGLQDGFAKWDNTGAGTIAESNEDIASPRTYDKLEPVIDELAGAAAPFSLFVHLFEPHATWLKHKKFPFTGKDSRINSYDSEIAFVDSYVGKIVAKLKSTGLWDRSVFVIISDHGEGFNEHGFFFHGQTLYNEVLHVPLIIRVPGWPARRVDTPTSIVDLGPTVLDLFDYPIPDEFDGQSLEPAMVGQTMPPRPIYAELLPYTSWKEHHKAVILGKYKFIAVYSAGSEELYDLAADPGETTNLVTARPELTVRMRALLEQFSHAP